MFLHMCQVEFQRAVPFIIGQQWGHAGTLLATKDCEPSIDSIIGGLSSSRTCFYQSLLGNGLRASSQCDFRMTMASARNSSFSCKRRAGMAGAGSVASDHGQTCRDGRSLLRHQMLPPTRNSPTALFHATLELHTLAPHVSRASCSLCTRWFESFPCSSQGTSSFPGRLSSDILSIPFL